MERRRRRLRAADLQAATAGLKGEVRFDVPLSEYTSFRIGGPADALVEIRHTGINLNGTDRSCAALTFTATGSITGANTLSVTSGVVTVYGAITATLTSTVNLGTDAAFICTDAGGNIVLGSASNTWSGDTAILGGTVTCDAASVLVDGSALTVASGATLDLDGHDQTVGSLAGAGTVALDAGTLTCGGDGTSTTFSGAITGRAA